MTDHVALTLITASMLCLSPDALPVVNALLLGAVLLVGRVPLSVSRSRAGGDHG